MSPVLRSCFGLGVFLVAGIVVQDQGRTQDAVPSLTNQFSILRPYLPLERLSCGGLMLLNHGDLVQWPSTLNRKSTDPSIVAGLDPRVGLNLQLGPDPPQLPSNQRAQAEPHIVRDPMRPDKLVATFQEGRYATDGGAIDWEAEDVVGSRELLDEIKIKMRNIEQKIDAILAA